IGTVLFRLYDEVVPMTADNFRMLATGQQGYGYHGMVLSCVILGFLIQGGDCDNGSVFDGVSLFIPWGRNFTMKHCTKGLLSMVNFWKDSNASQFFIHMNVNCFLDGSNVVFGQFISNLFVNLLTYIYRRGSQSCKYGRLTQDGTDGRCGQCFES
ncbi:hypothetical protein PILCRDRAFT_81382, partial [Piloderma croceum F 1598]